MASISILISDYEIISGNFHSSIFGDDSVVILNS